MSDLLRQRSALICQFEEHLARARWRYLAVAGHFLKYIGCDGRQPQWLRERRELAAETISERTAEEGRFLSWYGERNEAGTLSAVALADVDAYLQSRAPSLRPVSRKGVAQRMRCFLRFAHGTGRIECSGFRDCCVDAP